MECVPGAWVLTAGEMGRIVLMEGSSKGYFLGYGHICMCNNYEGTSCFLARLTGMVICVCIMAMG